ncbi:arylsulfatase [Acidobacteria bacterium AH-259-G07]|nr:arylsulfatase [Acidobacteria bacterium AH-259-G07]
MRRREFLKKTGIVSAAVTMSRFGLTAQPERRPPNIIFIMADDLGYGHLGCYGQKLIQTPNIDRLAADGMRFTQVYAGCTVCAPSRSVLMTGLHMGHTPVRGNSGGIPLREEDLTVAEVLKQAGYATGCFGKWGLGEAGTSGVATRQGLDEFFGYLHQIHAHFYYPEYLWKNDTKWPLPGNAGGGRLPGNALGKRDQYAPDEIIKHALTFIRANSDRPFFCYLPTTIPHVELVVPEESLQLYQGKFEEKPCDDARPGYVDPREPKATLAAMITHMDKHVGQVMALLKELCIDEETIVFFTSDNGAQGGYCTYADFFNATGPLRGYKGSMYEGGLRVPMVARWPGKIAAGQVNDHVWYFADIMPTLAELAEVKPPEGIDGISVLPTLLGENQVGRKQERHEFLYWEYGSRQRFRQAVRMGDWKAVRSQPGAPLELYNLRKDIGEKKNVAAQQPGILAKIVTYLKTCRTDPFPQIEPEKIKGQRYR